MSYPMEAITRPFVTIQTRPQEVVTVAPPTDLDTLPPAYLAWGGKSEFITPSSQLTKPYVVEIPDFDPTDLNTQITDIQTQLDRFTSKVTWLESEGSIFDTDPDDIEATEVERVTSTVRVYNPAEEELPEEDRTQWVDVERIDSIVFRIPSGERWRFVLNHGVA